MSEFQSLSTLNYRSPNLPSPPKTTPARTSSSARTHHEPTLFTLPLDLTRLLSPTRALAIHLPPPFSSHHPSKILDLTKYLPSLFSPAEGITPHNLLSAHKASLLTPAPPLRYVLEQQNLLGTHLAVLDAEGNEVAEWRMPVLRFYVPSVVEIKFPRGGGESEVIEIRKIVEEKEKGKEKETELEKELRGKHHEKKMRAESFVKDGVVYVWEVEMEDRRQKALFKVVHDENGKARKREVALFAQQNPHDREGLLVLDGRETDELLVVLTVCAMVEAKDDFLK